MLKTWQGLYYICFLSSRFNSLSLSTVRMIRMNRALLAPSIYNFSTQEITGGGKKDLSILVESSLFSAGEAIPCQKAHAT